MEFRTYFTRTNVFFNVFDKELIQKYSAIMYLLAKNILSKKKNVLSLIYPDFFL